jgi:hypothetical protein
MSASTVVSKPIGALSTVHGPEITQERLELTNGGDRVTRLHPPEKRQNGEGLGLGRAGTPAGVVVGVDTAVQHRTIPSIDDSRQATLCA